jgi:hypothetical protein
MFMVSLVAFRLVKVPRLRMPTSDLDRQRHEEGHLVLLGSAVLVGFAPWLSLRNYILCNRFYTPSKHSTAVDDGIYEKHLTLLVFESFFYICSLAVG